MQLGERLRRDTVVRPATLLSIRDEPRIAQHLQVKGQPRLRCIEIGLQIADATLPLSQHVENSQSRLVGECVEQLRRARLIGFGECHA